MKILKQLLLMIILATATNHLALAQADKDFDEDTVLAILSQEITKLDDEKIKIIPIKIQQKLVKCEFIDELNNMDMESQNWLHQNFENCAYNIDIGENFVKLKGKSQLNADDVTSILYESFWCRLKGKPFDLKKSFELIKLYWLEMERPHIEFAPEGKGKVDWIWKLHVASRPKGIIHVGIDTKTRRFLCYELTVGVYYPEGETLERIYTEIVQDPLAAGTSIGKGRMEKINKETLQGDR